MYILTAMFVENVQKLLNFDIYWQF